MAKNYPTLGNSAIATPTIVPTVGDANTIFSARVVDVNLEPSSNPLSLFQITNGWGSIGAIRFQSLNTNRNTNEQITTQASVAYPMDINFKKIPTLGEIVFILQGFSKLPLKISDAESFGLPMTVWFFVAWGEFLSGIGLLIGGILKWPRRIPGIGDILTRFCGIVICGIMTGVILMSGPESFLEVLLYDNLHIMLYFGGLFFALRGNRAS